MAIHPRHIEVKDDDLGRGHPVLGGFAAQNAQLVLDGLSGTASYDLVLRAKFPAQVARTLRGLA